ncbi:MAG: UDP-N-acetylglucosamine--N-acetylmuramyl-(pentapeptide) pyrophosphoryl-undecaprenol N-acetylglucosamine transferase [Gemmatimonadetes bacterium]|nr:UDP-N-acetylglucosamine--N-acetylmuramyl-(pentapeptide) pyrophosphoryl-undecaprenol N-acetylglucosamine transferase [Gemmatimonadota bacterium]MYB97044.1 UDP-N-acetylglucosamine--N-acetylmuramyl-(pentapeptide) pyrophosphoryl-undecaprenol N-acetylglucosamine transferase [Gemmatimonadota bacterium]MYI45513.1 UDP-N-acetylglucosamine--N-acetylmuramyl-(pentapeptide) pyrophosphoryl-undecaprenol N-acetylglucosamine transferase [Gemmatimonadota bacterium]
MMVVFSGGGTAGHFHPARNIAEALTGEMPEVRPYFVGTEGRIEAAELPRSGYPYRLLPVAGLQSPLGAMRRSGGGAGRLAGIFRAVTGNVRALWLLARAVLRLVPDFRRRGAAAVVLTGGYVCAPAGLAGRLLGLPVVLQEQNRQPGRTTRFLSRWATQIHLAYPEAAGGLRGRARERVLHSGNPIRPLPPTSERDRDDARRALGVPVKGHLVLVVGGSQGARKMNQATIDILQDDMPIDNDFVLWVTGRAHYEAAEAALAGVPRHRFRIVPYLEGGRMYQALAAADLVVSRAGAMATSEFLAWGLPAILVPLPTAAGDHQSANARALEAAGAAVHLPERDDLGADLDGDRLWSEVRRLLDAPGRLSAMSAAARERARPDAAREVAAAIAALLRPVPAGAAS